MASTNSIGSCKVPLGALYVRGSLDSVQAVHRKSGKLLGHMRFHLSLLVPDGSGGTFHEEAPHNSANI